MAKTSAEDELDAAFGVDEPEALLDPTGLLSNAEVLEARAKAKATVLADRKAAAMKAIEAKETERLRIEEGMTTGIDSMDEIVNFTVDLAPYADKIMLNGPLGMIYWQGQTYSVPRHVANSLSEHQFRSWRSEDQMDGKSLTQTMQRRHNTAIDGATGAVKRAPNYGGVGGIH